MKLIKNAYGRFDTEDSYLCETWMQLRFSDGQTLDKRIPNKDRTFEFHIIETCSLEVFFTIMKELYGEHFEANKEYLLNEFIKDTPARIARLQSHIDDINADTKERIKYYKDIILKLKDNR